MILKYVPILGFLLLTVLHSQTLRKYAKSGESKDYESTRLVYSRLTTSYLVSVAFLVAVMVVVNGWALLCS